MSHATDNHIINLRTNMKQYETPSVTLMTVSTELGFATSGEEKFSGSYINPAEEDNYGEF